MVTMTMREFESRQAEKTGAPAPTTDAVTDLHLRAERLRQVAAAMEQEIAKYPNWVYPKVYQAWKRLKPEDLEDNLVPKKTTRSDGE